MVRSIAQTSRSAVSQAFQPADAGRFAARQRFGCAADRNVGDTADWKVCATCNGVEARQTSAVPPGQRVTSALTPALSPEALHYPHLFMKFNHLVLVLQQVVYSITGCLNQMHPLIVRRPLNPLTGRSTNSPTRNCPINACSRACT